MDGDWSYCPMPSPGRLRSRSCSAGQPGGGRFAADKIASMERRLLLAILLTFVVLTAYQWLIPKPPPESAATTTSHAVDAKAPQSPAGTSPSAAPAPALPPVETVVASTTATTIVVQNNLVRAVFSNRGATLLSWQLQKYHGAGGVPVEPVPHDLP